MRTRSQSGVAGSDANTSARSTAVSRAPSVGARRSTRSAVADGAVPSRVAASGAGATSEMPGGAGRVDRQVAERTGRSARVGAVSGLYGGVDDAGRMVGPDQEGRQAAGLVRNSWGLGAGVLGRRVRVRWPAEEASFDGVMHAWLPGERRHVVRYDDGDEVSHDLCEDQVEWLEGEHEQREQVDAAPVSVPDIVGSVVAEGRAVPPAEVSPSPCRSALQDGLQSPPVPKRLAEFFCTPRVLSGSGVNVGAEADGAEQEQQERVADAAGNPWPSPGMERRLYVGPLFQPVEGEWCGHSMCSMPPTGVVASDGETATFSWVFCPFILDALGWRSSFPNLSRSDEWTRIVDRLAHVFREAGISWEVAADYILEPAVHPFHFSGRRQEELIELEQQFDANGKCLLIDLANCRPDVEFLSEDGQLVQSRRRGRGASGAAGSRSPRPDAASRGSNQPLVVGEGVGAAVAGEMNTAVPEACDAPVVEAEMAWSVMPVDVLHLTAVVLSLRDTHGDMFIHHMVHALVTNMPKSDML
ncbi:hypothetical protein CYMTET_6098 [Cymbomonas tetramitiformis]|uniref:Uncharacterized protein n=1 Tax=Cymbomonas tetramitiformis TaxID=36881 RepID=A0AAE0GXY8_9CHLO|nr:hypothetical protein CYMTET_6098 [Cymbomonas tetramitiformis]